MNLDFLEFEQPIAELQEKIEALKRVGADQDINIADEVARLQKKNQELTRRTIGHGMQSAHARTDIKMALAASVLLLDETHLPLSQKGIVEHGED